MRFKKILCIIKTTQYEQNKKIFSTLSTDRKENLLQEYERHSSFIRELKETMKRLGFSVRYTKARFLPKEQKDYDLIITCGGDGTFLTAAHHIQNTPLLGLNSNYHQDQKQGSIGALTSITSINLKENLQRLKEGKYQIKKRKRLYLKVNGEQQPFLALNDIFIGNKKAYKSSDLTIINNILINNSQQERFSCSGLLVASPTGSTAWYRNAGGKIFSGPYSDLQFGFIIREPNLDRKPSFTQGLLPENKELNIIINSHQQVLSFDSQDTTYLLKPMDELRIGLDQKKPLKVVTFEDMAG